MNFYAPARGVTSRARYKKALLVMKLLMLFLTAAIMQVSAATYAQRITLNEKNASLEKVIDKLRQQSGYDFFGNLNLLQKAQPVTVSLKNASVDEALKACFAGQPLTYEITDKAIVIKQKEGNFLDKFKAAFSASDIKGSVTDGLGHPLPGATVAIKGTSTKTVTDNDGRFYLPNVTEGSILSVSFIGYVSQEVTITSTNANSIVFNLKPATSKLDEVVINTGYQKIKPNEVLGAVAVVDNKALNRQVGTGILNRLNGVVTGVLFDDSKTKLANKKTNINIRGLSTINAQQDPLIIIDNFPYDGDINNINPNDVENVTLLKDAAAASIWGARAGNGVIVITTKKGRFNQALKVEFNANTTIGRKPDLYYLPQIGSADEIKNEQFLYGKGYYNSLFTNNLKPAIPSAVEIFRKRAQGTITSADSARQINALNQVDSRDEYGKYFYQNQVKQQYAVNVRGGSGNVAYFLSGGYDKNVDELAGKYDRFVFHSENSYRPTKKLLVSFGVFYTQSKSQSGKPAFNSVTVGSRILPYLKFADDQGNPLAIAKDYREIYTDTAGAGKLLNWKYYPLEDWKHNTTQTSLWDMLVNTGINYQLTSALSFDVKYQYDRQQSNTQNLQDIDSYAARDYINRFSQLNRSTGVVKYIVPPGGILQENDGITESHKVRGQVNFIKSFNEHSINAIIGSEISETKNSGNNYRAYGYNGDVLSYSNVDVVNSYPSFVNGSFSNVLSGFALSSLTNRFVSLYGNALYTYKEKYSLTASARQDASNLFGVNTNDKWNPLWSMGVGWKLSRENFYKSSLFPELSLRATYGFSGNVDPSRTAVTTLRNQGGANYTNLPYSTLNQPENSSLRWEKVRMVNLALDFAIKNRVIEGSFDFYFKNSTDLYAPVLIDYTVGVNNNTLIKNAGDIAGHGIDVTLRTMNINRDVRWSSTFLVGYYKDKTVSFYRSSNIASSFISSGKSVNPIVGEPLYSIVSYKWGGLDPANGNPRGYVNNSLNSSYSAITSSATGMDGLVYNGPAQPTVYGSVINEISWKNFTLDFNIGFRLGYYFRANSINYSGWFAGAPGHADYYNRWQKPGDEATTNVPSLIYPVTSNRDNFYLNSEATVHKADNIRLNYVNLSYEFGRKSRLNLPFDRLTLFVNGSNLGILWKSSKINIDPDYPTSFPPLKTIAFGIRGNF